MPLTYTLSMHACLSERPTERPTFEQAATLLRDVAVEVTEGRYVNSNARVQVPLPLPHRSRHNLPRLCVSAGGLNMVNGGCGTVPL